MEILHKIWDKIKLSEPVLLYLASSLLSFLTPLKFVLIGVLGLGVIDASLAIILAVKRKQPIESAKLRSTLKKFFIYFGALVAGYLCEISFLGPKEAPSIITKSLGFLVSSTELKSVLENLSSLMSESNRINFWQAVMSTVQGKLDAQNIQSKDVNK